MKVYCLFDGFYSDRYLFGVYATLEAAQAAYPHEAHQPDWHEVERYQEATERAWSCDVKAVRIFGCGGWIDERELEGRPKRKRRPTYIDEEGNRRADYSHG
jgi:hypothetical protein